MIQQIGFIINSKPYKLKKSKRLLFKKKKKKNAYNDEVYKN